MDNSLPPRPECIALVKDIDRRTTLRANEIRGLRIRYEGNQSVLAILEAAGRLNDQAGREEVIAAYHRDQFIREDTPPEHADSAMALTVEPELHLAELYGKTRDSLLSTVLNFDVRVQRAITPRKYR